MATTIFNNLVLATARRLKDSRTLADSTVDTGKRYSSAILSEYLNRSIRDFLTESFQKFGEKAFTELFPDYVKTGSAITLTAGVGVRPSDCFTIMDLIQSTTKFRKIRQNVVEDVIAGIDAVIVPSSSRPVFYEEGANFKTRGVTTGDVVPRYIKTHQDIVVSYSSPGNGKFGSSLGPATYTVATKTIAGATMNTAFASGDENKKIMFRTVTVVYFGIIASVASATSVTVQGDNLPAAGIGAGDLIAIMVSDNDITDLTLNAFWHGEIINKAVGQATQDSKVFNS